MTATPITEAPAGDLISRAEAVKAFQDAVTAKLREGAGIVTVIKAVRESINALPSAQPTDEAGAGLVERATAALALGEMTGNRGAAPTNVYNILAECIRALSAERGAPTEPTDAQVDAGLAALKEHLGAEAVIDRDAVFALRAMFRAAALVAPASPAETGWRPIATARREPNVAVLLCVTALDGVHQVVGEGYWYDGDDASDEGWWWAQTSPGDYAAERIANLLSEPTHWQPLPAPPSVDAQEGKR